MVSDKQQTSLVLKILELCMAINAKGEKYAWFEFSGHTNQVDVRLRPNPCDDYMRTDLTSCIYLDHSNALQRLVELADELGKYKCKT